MSFLSYVANTVPFVSHWLHIKDICVFVDIQSDACHSVHVLV